LFWDDDYAASGMVVATASNHQSLYNLDMEQRSHVITAIQPVAMAVKTPADLWHHRLGYLCHYGMNLLRRGLAEGVTYDGQSEDKCISCLEGKKSRLPFQKGKAKRAKERLEIVHTDLCGPMSVESLHGHNYVLLFMDDFTRKVFPYFLKTKDEVKSKFLIFKALVENETGLKIKVLWSDNGTEYVNKDLENYLLSEGLHHQTTIPHTPEQNGVAEQTNRSVIEKTRCMLHALIAGRCSGSGSLPKESLSTQICSRCHTRGKWTGKHPDLSHLRVFGCTAYALIPKESRKKLDAKSKPYIFLGYCENSKGYKLADPSCPKKQIKARHVFVEDCFNSENRQQKVVPSSQLEPLQCLWVSCYLQKGEMLSQ
jgi:transposase InsO family protein